MAIQVTPPSPGPLIELGGVKDPIARKSLEGLQNWVARLKDQLFAASQTVGGGLNTLTQVVGTLQSRVKDIYVFAQPGTIAVATDPLSAGMSPPLRVVADSTLVELRCDSEAGAPVVQVLADGVRFAQIVANTGTQTRSRALAKETKLQAYIVDPGVDSRDCTLEVRCA